MKLRAAFNPTLVLGTLIAVAALGFAPPAAADKCSKGFYACNINADGTLDQAHPGCCLKVKGVQRACGPGFYSCKFNAGGAVDSKHPGCCLHVPGVTHVQ